MTVVRVGVVDSGWKASQWHRRVRPGRGFCRVGAPFMPANTTDFYDRIGHGTACSRMILKLARCAEVTPLRVFHDRLETSPEVVCAALEWARPQNFAIVNMSLSTFREDARDSLYAACYDLVRSGTFIVAAANNGTHDGYPAVFEGVAGVSISPLAGYSYPSGRWPMDFVVQRGTRVPGIAVHGTVESTSQAAAFVSGCAAWLRASGSVLSICALRESIVSRFPDALSRSSE